MALSKWFNLSKLSLLRVLAQSNRHSFPHEDPRIWDSTDALELKEVPGKLLVMGGGIIGLEMGTVYSSLRAAN